ncbi:MAG TPA: EamA family transporter [Anaerolineae bacterium]|nr:EamA family transporter [Anaerolineae bacterium]
MKGYAFVLAAAAMWGTIGIFFTLLYYTFGMSALAIAFLRAGIAALILIIALALRKRDALRVSRELLVTYILFGLFGVAFFYILNIEAVILTNVATASVLLYTAPVFVTLFAWRWWGEPLTARKILAVIAAFIGCALVARAYDPGALQLNGFGVLVAASAGLAYALFTVFTKYLSTRASPWTTVTYSLVFGTVFLLPLQWLNIPGIGAPGYQVLFKQPLAWLALLGLCLGPTLGSYAFYNLGLQTVPASVASVIATIEPIVAAVGGFVFFGQTLEALQIVGAAIIIAAALSLTLQSKPVAAQQAVVRIDG